MHEILGIGGIDPRRVSDALRIRGHDPGHKGQACTYQRDPSHDVTCLQRQKKMHNKYVGCTGVMQPLICRLHLPASVPIPKFVSLRGTLVYELRNRRTLATY